MLCRIFLEIFQARQQLVICFSFSIKCCLIKCYLIKCYLVKCHYTQTPSAHLSSSLTGPQAMTKEQFRVPWRQTQAKTTSDIFKVRTQNTIYRLNQTEQRQSVPTVNRIKTTFFSRNEFPLTPSHEFPSAEISSNVHIHTKKRRHSDLVFTKGVSCDPR